MRVVTVKLPDALDRRLEHLAKASHRSRSAVIREALEAYARVTPQTVAGLAGDLVGSLDGPEDLSTAAEHLEGYGE